MKTTDKNVSNFWTDLRQKPKNKIENLFSGVISSLDALPS